MLLPDRTQERWKRKPNWFNSTTSTPRVIALHLKFRLIQWTFEQSHALRLCPGGKGLATKDDETFFGDQTFWCCTEWLNGIKHVWMNKIFSATFDQIFDVVHILSNTIKKGVQAKKGLVTKQCLIVFYRQTFSILVELSIPMYVITFLTASLLKSTLEQQKCVPWLFVKQSNQPINIDKKTDTSTKACTCPLLLF